MENLHNYFEKNFCRGQACEAYILGKAQEKCRRFKGNAAACDAVGQSLLSGGVQFRQKSHSHQY